MSDFVAPLLLRLQRRKIHHVGAACSGLSGAFARRLRTKSGVKPQFTVHKQLRRTFANELCRLPHVGDIGVTGAALRLKMTASPRARLFAGNARRVGAGDSDISASCAAVGCGNYAVAPRTPRRTGMAAAASEIDDNVLHPAAANHPQPCAQAQYSPLTTGAVLALRYTHQPHRRCHSGSGALAGR